MEDRRYHADPVRLGLLCVVLLLVCGTATACATGLSGAAVGAAQPPSRAPTTPVGVNLLPNGSFTAGPAPWLSNEAADLAVTRTLAPSTALLLLPTTPGSVFSAKAVVTTTPSTGQKYSFVGWMKGSPDLVGARVQIVLGALQMTGVATGVMVTMAQKYQPLRRHWRHFAIRGVVPNVGATNVTAIVAVQSRSKHSWLALSGVTAKLLPSAAKRTGHGRS